MRRGVPELPGAFAHASVRGEHPAFIGVVDGARSTEAMPVELRERSAGDEFKSVQRGIGTAEYFPTSARNMGDQSFPRSRTRRVAGHVPGSPPTVSLWPRWQLRRWRGGFRFRSSRVLWRTT